jgi:hypothetical protein
MLDAQLENPDVCGTHQAVVAAVVVVAVVAAVAVIAVAVVVVAVAVVLSRVLILNIDTTKAPISYPISNCFFALRLELSNFFCW